MTKNLSDIEALQFYLDNDLSEIISDKPQNLFGQKDRIKKTNEDKKSTTVQNFFKPQISTNEALSILAKKQQNEILDSVSNQKFMPLNEIVAQAKKVAKSAQNLDELRQAIENFDGCNLKKMATNMVFGDGFKNSKIMLIGEAPGNHEDLQGIPFCGDSGKVLDEMFGAIKMTRQENFYITNVIFWRPPGNRRPTEEELAICRPFVERHIQILNPEILVLVGATAMNAIVGGDKTISEVRGKFIDFAPKFLTKKIKTFTIFHPSYLMRQPSKKKVAWRDMLALEQFLKIK
jgi:DNA polymerase